jgi:hypothetical protein
MKPRTQAVLLLMAVILAAATATAALAAPKKKRLPPVEQQISDTVQDTSQAMLRLKVKRPPIDVAPPTLAAGPR